MSHDSKLRSACQDRCAEFGDPPCYELDRREDEIWTACSPCLVDCGMEPPPEPLDPNAVLRDLI